MDWLDLGSHADQVDVSITDSELHRFADDAQVDAKELLEQVNSLEILPIVMAGKFPANTGRRVD